MPPADPRRRLARFTGAELDALSLVTPDDIDAAARGWRADAPRESRAWLDATAPVPKEDVRAETQAKKDTGR